MQAKNGFSALMIASKDGHREVAAVLLGAQSHRIGVRSLRVQQPQCGKCDNPGCGKRLQKPLQCSRCKKAQYCSKDCQVAAWKSGHKRECVAACGGGGVQNSQGSNTSAQSYDWVGVALLQLLKSEQSAP